MGAGKTAAPAPITGPAVAPMPMRSGTRRYTPHRYHNRGLNRRGPECVHIRAVF
jgi:hypothetical protein